MSDEQKKRVLGRVLASDETDQVAGGSYYDKDTANSFDSSDLTVDTGAVFDSGPTLEGTHPTADAHSV